MEMETYRNVPTSVSGDAIEVWCLPLVEAADDVCTLTSEEELQLRRIVSATRRGRIRAAWSARRAILGRVLRCDPRQVAVRRSPDGVRYAEAPHQTLHISLSHSGAWMMFALSQTTQIGVDIERVNPAADALRLARRFFHPDEAEQLALVSRERRSLEFFRAWSRKEALLKATGGGVPSRLCSVPSGLDRTPGSLSYEGTAWVVLDLEAPESHVASLAARGSVRPEVRFHNEI